MKEENASNLYEKRGIYHDIDFNDCDLCSDEAKRGAAILINQSADIAYLCSTALLASNHIGDVEENYCLPDICGRLLYETCTDLKAACYLLDI